MMIFETVREGYFTHETFKLSMDCKMLFLTHLARNYGRNPAIVYYGFRVPLSSFGRDENIRDSLLKFDYPGRHIIIGLQEEDPNEFFKTVVNKNSIDK